ncbi:MAG: DUF255 domain-containing protein [Bacteroidetes bacterium]|nr:MAG: DUF255 domain-containing protein [Bacteroidota bacterium]
MKKFLVFGSAIVLLTLVYAFRPAQAQTSDQTTETKVNWMSFEEAVKASEKHPKKIMIDLYTDWCGWCKRMDKTTFEDPKVVKYLNDNFYAVKFNAEQKEEINFSGHTFKWVAGGRNGIHTLAYSLVEGRLSYPTVVYLNEKFERILISPGYKQTPDMLKELKYTAEEIYQKMGWEEYLQKK